MLFLLATPEYNNSQSNTTKVKVHLRNGIAEILEQHQDLMGKVENNLVEIETLVENKLEKLTFILQDAVFVVSTKGLDAAAEVKGTTVYIYARRVRELNSKLSLEEVTKQYEQRSKELEIETLKLTSDSKPKNLTSINSKIVLLKDEIEFLNRVQAIVKEGK